MHITAQDRVAALAIAQQAERECLERAQRANNWVAAAINQQRFLAATTRLNQAALATGVDLYE